MKLCIKNCIIIKNCSNMFELAVLLQCMLMVSTKDGFQKTFIFNSLLSHPYLYLNQQNYLEACNGIVICSCFKECVLAD